MEKWRIDSLREHNNKGDWFISNERGKWLGGVICPSHIGVDSWTFREVERRESIVMLIDSTGRHKKDNLHFQCIRDWLHFPLGVDTHTHKHTSTLAHAHRQTYLTASSSQPECSSHLSVTSLINTLGGMACDWQTYRPTLWQLGMEYTEKTSSWEHLPRERIELIPALSSKQRFSLRLTVPQNTAGSQQPERGWFHCAQRQAQHQMVSHV